MTRNYPCRHWSSYGLQSSDYDICYTLVAYSASLEQRGTSKADLEAKLLAVADQMFPNLYDCNRHCDQHSNDRGRYPGGGVSGHIRHLHHTPFRPVGHP